MARRARRLRKVLRRSAFILGGLLLAVVVVIGGAVLAVHTDWGRSKLRAQIESRANDALRGTLSIGRLEGSVLDGITLRDVNIDYPDGERAVHIDVVEIDYSLLPLTSRTVQADELRIEGVRVIAYERPDGTLSLSELGPPPSEESEPAPDEDAGQPWRVHIHDLTVEDGRFTLHRPRAETVEIRDFGVSAALDLAGGDVVVALDSIGARWPARELEVDAHGWIAKKSDTVTVQDFELNAADSRLEVPVAQADLATGIGRGRFALDVKAADVRRALPDSPWRADLDLEGSAARTSTETPWRLHTTGAVGDARVAVRADIRPEEPGAVFSFEMDDVNPRGIIATAPPGRLQVRGGGDLSGDRLQTLEGSFTGTVEGTLQGRHIEEARVIADADRGDLDVELRGRGAGARVLATANIDASSDSPRIRTSRLIVSANDLSRTAPPDIPAGGSLQLEARATGRLDALDIQGELRSDRLRWDAVRAGEVRGTFTMRDVPAAPTGTVVVEATDVQRDQTRIGDVTLKARAEDAGRHIEAWADAGDARGPYAGSAHLVVHREGGDIRLTVPELAVRTRSLVWSASGTRATYSAEGVLDVQRFELASDAGALSAGGRLRTGGRTPRGDFAVQLDDLDLERLGPALGSVLPPLRGTANVSADVSLPRGPVELRVSADGVRWRQDIPPIDGRLEARIAEGELDATVEADADDLGEIELRATTDAPRLVTDAEAWTTLRADAVRNIDAEIRGVPVRRLASFAGEQPIEGGTLGARLHAGDGLETLDLTVTGHELHTSELRDPIALKVSAHRQDRELTATLRIDARRQGAIAADTTLTLPPDPLDVAAYRRLGTDALRRASVTARDLDLGRLRKLAAEPPPIEGSVDVDLIASEKGDDVMVRTTFRGLRVPPARRGIDGFVDVAMSPEKTEVRSTTSLGDDQLVATNLVLGAGSRMLLRDRDLDQVRNASVKGTVRIPDFPLRLLQHELDLSTRLEGRLVASADVSGRLDAPVVEASARIPGARVGDLAFQTVHGNGNYEAGDWNAEIRMAQKSGGKLSLSSGGNVDRALQVRLDMVARDFRLDFVSAFLREARLPVVSLVGALDGNLQVRGSRQAPELQGWLRVEEGGLRMRQYLRPLEDMTLDVSMYEGSAGYRVRADSGGGTIDSKGRIELDALSPTSFETEIEADDLPVIAGAMPVSISTRTEIEGEHEDGLWRIDTTLDETLVRLPSQTGRGTLHETGPLASVVFADELRHLEEEGAPSPTVIKMNIDTDDHILVRSEEAEVLLKTDLALTVVEGQSSLSGSVNVVRGRVRLLDRRYDIVNAVASFEGRMPPNPRINVRLAHAFREMTLYIDVSGTLEKPTIDFASDPAIYDRAQLLSFVLGGSPGGGDSQDESLGGKATGAVAGIVSSQLEGVLKQTFPVDHLRIGTEDAGTSFVTVGKWLTDDLFIAYRRNFAADADENTNEAHLEYQIFRNWILESRYGDQSVGSADLLWTKRF